MGMQNGKSLWKSLAAPYKIKYSHTIPSSSCTPWYLLKWFENLGPHRNLHMNVYNNFIHNCPNFEVTKMPFKMSMDKHYLYIWTVEYYSAIKTYKLWSHRKTWNSLKCLLLSEKNQSEKATYCMISIKKYLWKGETMETVKTSMVARRGKGWISGIQGIFRKMKLFFVKL